MNPAVDHRRATADRNREGILAAAETLLARRETLSMVAVAKEAGVSRPTLYAHFRTLGDVVEAVTHEAVLSSIARVEEARPEEGPAEEALRRMVAASWEKLADFDAIARGAAEHLPAGALHKTHAPLMKIMSGLVERGQREGAFRSDLPAAWLVNVYYSLVHGADDVARSRQLPREDVLRMLTTTLIDVFTVRP